MELSLTATSGSPPSSSSSECSSQFHEALNGKSCAGRAQLGGTAYSQGPERGGQGLAEKLLVAGESVRDRILIQHRHFMPLPCCLASREELFAECVEHLEGGKKLDSEDLAEATKALEAAFAKTDERLLKWWVQQVWGFWSASHELGVSCGHTVLPE